MTARPSFRSPWTHLTTSVGAVLLAIGLCQGHARSQPIGEVRAGTIVPSVVVRAEPDQTYALYLPSSYGVHRKWPVIFAFDPSARGQIPLECYKEAAEKYGYILVASNVSRNGPMPPSLRAGLAMMRDAAERFSIDERRIYVTGFSGGARVASAMAQMQKGRIAGVIGSAGGFPAGDVPSAQTPFAFCGTVGDEDYNWLEMHRLDRALASLDKPRQLLRFPGGHTWPPKDVAMAAVEWLELQAMRAETRAKDAALIEGWRQEGLVRARDEENRGALFDAWLSYSDLVTTFRGLTDVQPFEARASALHNQEAVRKQIRREREAEELEDSQRVEIARYIGQLSDIEQQVDATRQLFALINVLERNEQKARTRSERSLARRLIEHANITAYYTGQPLFDAGEYRSAMTYFQIQAAIHPESSGIQYRIAVTYGRAGDGKKALEALERAAGRGFADATRVETERGFEKLRSEPRYLKALDAIRKNRKPS